MAGLIAVIAIFYYPTLALIAVILLWRGVVALERLTRITERFERGQARDRRT